jgi:hypothetical protein
LAIKAVLEIESYYVDLPIELDIVVVNGCFNEAGENLAGLGVIVHDVDRLPLLVELGLMRTKNNNILKIEALVVIRAINTFA